MRDRGAYCRVAKCNRHEQNREALKCCHTIETYLDDAVPPRMEGPKIHITLVYAVGPQHLIDPINNRRAARSKMYTRQAKRSVKSRNEKRSSRGDEYA